MIDEHRGDVWGRADLQASRDRPVDVLRGQGASGVSVGASCSRRCSRPTDP